MDIRCLFKQVLMYYLVLLGALLVIIITLLSLLSFLVFFNGLFLCLIFHYTKIVFLIFPINVFQYYDILQINPHDFLNLNSQNNFINFFYFLRCFKILKKNVQ